MRASRVKIVSCGRLKTFSIFPQRSFSKTFLTADFERSVHLCNKTRQIS